MKNFWKWFFGILIGLLVLAVIGGVVFLAVNRWGDVHWMMGERSFRLWSDRDEFSRLPMPMHPGGWFNTRGFFGFSLLRMFFGGLFWVGLITLSVIGMISLLRGRKSSQPLPAPAAQTPVPEPSPAQPRTCANCAHTVQDDWSHCPYCGNSLT